MTAIQNLCFYLFLVLIPHILHLGDLQNSQVTSTNQSIYLIIIYS